MGLLLFARSPVAGEDPTTKKYNINARAASKEEEELPKAAAVHLRVVVAKMTPSSLPPQLTAAAGASAKVAAPEKVHEEKTMDCPFRRRWRRRTKEIGSAVGERDLI